MNSTISLFSRREFLEFMGRSGVALAGAATLLPACTTVGIHGAGKLPFQPLPPSGADDLVLTKDFSYQLLARWNEPINDLGERFGFNNDYLAVFPRGENEALLWVNHEAVKMLFVSGYDGQRPRTKQQVIKEQENVGGSILHLRREKNDQWRVIKPSPLNRRVSARTPIPIVSARPIAGKTTAIGTLANCAGGVTPWGTVLTCEENYHDFYGEIDYSTGRARRKPSKSYKWDQFFDYSPEHYGWVVEVNPQTGQARKLTSMGRFAHECATVVLTTSGRCAVYLADDAPDECLYKFISDQPGSLDHGELFVADTENGRWLSLDIKKDKRLQKVFKDQTECLIRTREAARIVGGTPLARPEDIEIDPSSGAVFVALTNNVKRNNYHGSILKIEEKYGKNLGLEFTASTFLMGGKNSGFSCPDNLAFDQHGDLWMTVDISGAAMNQPPYTPFKNNGLFYIPMSGPHAGAALQVASAPTDAELTGPCFSPDGKTLFLSVQHPGETSKSLDQLTSHWPDGGTAIPAPSVVAIQGPIIG